jgi:hypothetical protein
MINGSRNYFGMEMLLGNIGEIVVNTHEVSAKKNRLPIGSLFKIS